MAMMVAAAAGLPLNLHAETEPIDLYPDTWVAIDDLERVLPTSAEQPLRTDKDLTVGIF